MRSRSGVFFSVLFPVMLLLVFATVFSGTNSGQSSLYVQNLDLTSTGAPTELSASFIRVLNQSGAFDLKTVPPNVEAKSYVQNQLGAFGGTFRLLVLPEEFHNDMLNGSLRARLGVVSMTTRSFLEEAGPFVPADQQTSIREGLQQLETMIEQTPIRNVSVLYVADPTNTASTIVQS
ncbi:MAG: hypothetical protein HY619_07790, partial [Thaumarchaeota archaeon]|nr:hypothetical protein [Nitrososphaerota archaeon]